MAFESNSMKNGSNVSPIKPLARVGDPYVTASGLVIEPDQMNGGPPEEVVTESVTAENFRPSKQRDKKELPAPPDLMKGIACIFVFTVLGLGDREIAEVLKIKVADLRSLKSQQAYKDCFDAVVEEFINANSELINARLAAYAHPALSQVAKIALTSKEEKLRGRYSADLLDRGGYAPKENAMRGAMSKSELRIVHIKADGHVDVSIGTET